MSINKDDNNKGSYFENDNHDTNCTDDIKQN